MKGRDGGPAQGRNVNVGMVALYDSVRREDNRPVIPPSSRKYVIGATADEIWSRLRETALAAGYGTTPRFQVIGDGATWIGNGAEKYLKSKYKAHFTEDGTRQWSEEAAKAWRYLDARRRHMNYGWLRRHGYLIGSGHIESACKVACGLRRTGGRGQAMGNSEGRRAFSLWCRCIGTLCDQKKEMGRFRPYCLLPNPSSLGAIFSNA